MSKWPCLARSQIQWNTVSKQRDFFWRTSFCTIPCAVDLSVLRGVPVLGCLWPGSCSVVRIGTPSLVLMKSPLYSASAADDRTIFMILHRTQIGPFKGG